MTTNFNPTTYTVTGVAGGDVNIQNDDTGKKYRRNIVNLKKVNDSWTVDDKNVNNDNLEHNNELTRSVPIQKCKIDRQFQQGSLHNLFFCSHRIALIKII